MGVVRIGDEPLDPAALVAAARTGDGARLAPAALERIAAGHVTMREAAGRRAVYGWTTGVGANRHVAVGGAGREHAVRLLRSHASGLGAPLDPEVVRATILVRLAQMAAGGGGHRPAVAEALAGLLGADPLPELHDGGGIGTGDLTVLAQLRLALAGEPVRGPAAAPPLPVEQGDALPFMSSNAASLALAVFAWTDVRELLDAGIGVAALSFHALAGNPEAFAAPLSAARPLPGFTVVCDRLRELTAGGAPPARLQDPFALRCLPEVAAALLAAAAGLHDVLAVDVNAAAENPLVAEDDVLHHGGFHAASLALALDALRLGLVPFAGLAAARLSHLMEPALTGLSPFLAADAPGASGLLIAEYAAGDALARLRTEATPTVTATLTISRGLEEHASFGWQGAAQARRAARQLRAILALEWVAAERALRQLGRDGPAAVAPARALAAGWELPPEDTPLAPAVEAAEAALPALAAFARA